MRGNGSMYLMQPVSLKGFHITSFRQGNETVENLKFIRQSNRFLEFLKDLLQTLSSLVFFHFLDLLF